MLWYLVLLKTVLGGTIPFDKSLKWFSFRNFLNNIPCVRYGRKEMGGVERETAAPESR